MMFFKIQDYSYDDAALEQLSKGLPLDLEPSGYVDLSIAEWFRMQKSLKVAREYLAKSEAAPTAPPAGTRWITVHPNGRDDEGQPVMIQDSGDGTAHIVAGAGGKLNGLKLNKIKSKEQYASEFEARREQKKTEAMEARLAEQRKTEAMSKEDRAVYRTNKKLEHQSEIEAVSARKAKKIEAEKQFMDYMARTMGWESAEFDEDADSMIRELKDQLSIAVDDGNKVDIKRLSKELSVLRKAKKRAHESQRKHFVSKGKEIVRQIEREVIGNSETRTQIESIIGDTGASELIKTENSSLGRGFMAGYKDSAESKGGLGKESLAQEKEERFQDRMTEIAEENPALANMIVNGIQTNRAINDIKNVFYEKEDLPKAPIETVEKKAEVLREYLTMKQTLAALQDDGTDEGEDEDGPKYGTGTKLSFRTLFTQDVADEATRIFNNRQAAVHSSLLATIEQNHGGSGKWIANGNFSGLNAIALAGVLNNEALDRDVVDVLGLGASAELLAMKARRLLLSDEYDDFAVGMEKYHIAVNEFIASEAVETARDLISKAEALQVEIDSTDPGQLAALQDLNESRLQYLDEANRVAGQALGSLEASAAMVAELKKKKDPKTIEANLGKISMEEAIIRARAIGLKSGDYDIDSVGGDKVLTILNPSRLIRNQRIEDMDAEEEIAAIKSGARDEKDWLPEGLVRRDAESFEDPGPDASLPADSVDNQSLGDTAPALKKAEEAIHRTLGEMPEGAFAFKVIEDLSPQDQTDIRRYWETKLYSGTMAAQGSKAGYQEKGISRLAAWSKFLKGSHGGDKESALSAIREDLIQNHSEEDMWGEKDPPPLARVIPGNWKTYRSNVDGAAELFQTIDDLSDPALVTDQAAASREREKLESELPEKLTELYESQMRAHYLSFMSGYSESQFTAGEERQEGSPWAEYVRMHGSVDRAQEAVMDCIKGDFLQRFGSNYAKVTKTKLKTAVQKIRNYQDHVLGLLDPEMRDSFKNKFTAQLASAGATVANRVNGKFASGSWKDAAYKYMEDQKKADAAQFDMFSGEDLKQDDGTEILSIGSRAEAQLASMIPQLTGSMRRGQKFNVSRGMDSNGVRQRAIKMLETAGRYNLTFGTGKGKTIISIGAFANLKAKGKAKRAIFAVPSVVQAQFGGEVNVFCEPGKFKVSSDPGLNREERIAALKGEHDMVVATHQSLRDDMIYLMAKDQGIDESTMKERFNAAPEQDRKALLKHALDAEGISFDMLTVDESHYSVNRAGKEDSTLSNVLGALNQNVSYFMNQSATPVKNDVSEAFDMLHKVAPERFSDRAEFMKRYGVDSDFSRQSLQRVINRYNYASQTNTGVRRKESTETVSLSPEQKTAYNQVESAFQAASKAQRAGKVDVDAMRILSPGAFQNKEPAEHEAIAKRLQESAGIIKEEAYNRIINQHDWKTNAKVSKVMDLISSKVYTAPHEKTGANAGSPKPGVLFAHNLKSISNLQAAMESRGLRVGVIQGSMNGAEKERVKSGFNPSNPADRQYDILLCSDAGATGLNLQNAAYLINYDLPHTSWLKQQREGRIDRMGQAHDEIEYHDIVSDTDHEQAKLERIKRKKELGSIFEEDPGSLDDSGLASMITKVRNDRKARGIEFPARLPAGDRGEAIA